jgi:hypothetical protein
LVNTLNGGLADVFEDQKRIAQEALHLKSKSQKFANVTGEWVTIVEGFDARLVAIGNFEAWIKKIEFDLNNLGGAMGKVLTKQAAAVAEGKREEKVPPGGDE